MMEVEMEDVRRRLYSPPVMIRLELHHPDDDDDEPAAPVRADGNPLVDVDRLTVADETSAAVSAGPPRIVDRGCLLPCFPGCHAPIYRAGHVITGHLLVRPLTPLLISGQPASSHPFCRCPIIKLMNVNLQIYNLTVITLPCL